MAVPEKQAVTNIIFTVKTTDTAVSFQPRPCRWPCRLDTIVTRLINAEDRKPRLAIIHAGGAPPEAEHVYRLQDVKQPRINAADEVIVLIRLQQ